jgi:YfiH family protein
MLTKSGPAPLLAPSLDALTSSGIRHGFFTRTGGVSDGIFSGLNVGMGSSDQREHVSENRRRVAEWLGVPTEKLATLHQVHSAETVLANDAQFSQRPKADAVVTDRPGIAIGILTADCGPILFCDPRRRIIGAAHAGWKGALTGILESAIGAMEKLGSRRADMIAVLGPSISQANYEVGPEFVEQFIATDQANDRYFSASPRQGHAMFDLSGYTVDRLARAGVKASALSRCTYGEEDLFYSYRRSVHRNEPDYGRQISAIVMEDN